MAGSKYSRIRKSGPRDDLPNGLRPRSAWEANIIRWLEALKAAGLLLRYAYEGAEGEFKFGAAHSTGNKKILLDFYLVWADGSTTWLEVKGFLNTPGGWLDTLDLSSLAGRDDDSRIKLERFRTYYPARARQTFVLGSQEYRLLQRAVAHLLPGWEYPAGQPSGPKRQRGSPPLPLSPVA